MQPYDSPEELAFRNEARSFLQANARLLPPDSITLSAIVAEWDPDEEEARLREATAWQRSKADAGWAGIWWPQQYGGRGGSLIEEVIFRQEESRFDVPHDALLVGLGWCGPAVMAHGTEEQRVRLLPALLRGDEVWCQLFSEPGAGSDLAGLRTEARRDGEEWVLTGQKVWTTFAHHSDWGLCIARHDPDAPKHRGLTAFMVDMKSEGVAAKPMRQMTGSANFNEVFLDEVRVPDAGRIGGVGDGWRVVISTFMWERIGALGQGERILGGLRRLIADRGRGSDGRVRARYADIHIRVEALRYTMMRLMTDIAAGRLPGPEGSIMKLGATSVLTDIYDLALDLLGPEGMLGAAGSEDWKAGFLGAPGLRVGGGTDEVQRNIIGERVLGLPGDIRLDKDVPFAEVPAG